MKQKRAITTTQKKFEGLVVISNNFISNRLVIQEDGMPPFWLSEQQFLRIIVRPVENSLTR